MRPLILIAILLFSGAARAAPPPEQAHAFIGDVVSSLSDAANAEDRTEAFRETSLRVILRDALATEPIGQFLFAGAPLELANDQQKDRYHELFPAYIAAAFASEIGELAEREIRIGEVVPLGEDEAVVQSRLYNTAGQMKAVIDWRVRWIEDDPRLLDVMVERVSPLVTKRQEFSSIARRKGVDALLSHMEEVVARSALTVPTD